MSTSARNTSVRTLLRRVSKQARRQLRHERLAKPVERNFLFLMRVRRDVSDEGSASRTTSDSGSAATRQVRSPTTRLTTDALPPEKVDAARANAVRIGE